MSETDHLEVFERIRSKYPDLSPSFKKIADYLLDRYRDAAFLPASGVAASAEVSESVVVRFAGALGYDGYPEMLRAIQRVVKRELAPFRRLPGENVAEDSVPSDDVLGQIIATDIENLRFTAADPVTVASFPRAVDMLTDAHEVFALGIRGLGNLAGMLGFLLTISGIRTHILAHGDAELFEHLRFIEKSDVLVAFSFQRYTRRTVDALDLAKRRGARTIVITESLRSPAAQVADLSLICALKSRSFFNSYTAAVTLVNALTTGVVNRRLRASRRALETLDELLPDEDFFGRDNGF